MRVALISPFSAGPARGNITTVRRIARHLPQQGWEVALTPIDTFPQQESRELPPLQILHAFHACHAGPLARQYAHKLGLPYLITITGSDLYDPLMREHPATQEALLDASAICCFDTLIAEQLAIHMPALSSRLTVIPQGVEPFPPSPARYRSADSFIILLPAALRQVKGILQAIDALAPLAAAMPRLRLWLAGGDLDAGYGALVRQRIDGLNWVERLGDVPHEQMGAVYTACDLVLNCSLFEGGMANSLLEALSCARAVLASDVPGNRSLIRHGETGWLFKDAEELRNQALFLADNQEALKLVGQTGKQYVLQHFSPESEARALSGLYRAILRSAA